MIHDKIKALSKEYLSLQTSVSNNTKRQQVLLLPQPPSGWNARQLWD